MAKVAAVHSFRWWYQSEVVVVAVAGVMGVVVGTAVVVTLDETLVVENVVVPSPHD